VEPRPASALATAHYGELMQGQVEDASGRYRRCLVSLPCGQLYSEVTFTPDGTRNLTVEPGHKQKARRAVELTLEYLGAGELGGLISIASNIVEGKGYGSSTTDCVAAARAAAAALESSLPEEELAGLVVQAETASDNTMFSRAVLFAQREGAVLEDYFVPLPNLEVLGIDTDTNGVVNTLNNPPAVYCWDEIQCFQTLVGALRRAIHRRDLNLLGRIATASATINERFLPKPCFSEIAALAEQAGALGVAAAHSGTVLSILLDPNDPCLDFKIDKLETWLEKLGVPQVFRFSTVANLAEGGCFDQRRFADFVGLLQA
jgi:uncharacterized protein involved in propanediol utilization